MSKDFVYLYDGSEANENFRTESQFINATDVVTIVYKDGSTHTGIVSRKDGNFNSWYVGTRPLWDVYYAPFKMVVRDSNILTVVNITNTAENWELTDVQI